MVRSPRGMARVRTRGTARFPVEALESRRLLSAGDLDLSFDGDGKVTTDLPGSQFEDGWAVAVQADNKVVAAGQVRRPEDLYGDMLVVRYNPDGTLDTTFGGGDGWVAIDFEGRDDAVREMVLAPGGKIVVAGHSAATVMARPPGQPPQLFDLDFAVARLNPDGSPDTTFDGDGLRRITVAAGPGNDQANDVVLRPDGGVFLVGSAGSRLAVVALRPDGSSDPAFSGDGVLVMSNDLPATGAVAGELDADGRLVIAANEVDSFGSPDSVFFARFLPSGQPDAGFGGGTLGPAAGWVRVRLVVDPFTPLLPFVSDLASLPGGKIAAVGGFGALRLNPNGARDTTFSDDGVAPGGSNMAVVVEADGSLLAAGPSTSSGGTPRLVRFRPDGSLGPLAGGGSNGHGSIMDLALAPDGRSVTVGTATPSSFVVNGATRPDLAVTRRLASGALDPTFGPGGLPGPGIAVTDLTGPGASTVVDVATLPGGKVLALGDHVSGNSEYVALVRYNADGSPDPSFGAGGTGVVYAGEQGYVYGASSVVVQPDGKVLVAGYIDHPVISTQEVLLLRYDADGRTDGSFGTGGRVVFSRVGNLSVGPSGGQALAMQDDGRIVLATTVGNQRVGLIRLMPDGRVDPSLGGNAGVATTVSSSVVGVEIAPGGKLVVLGNYASQYVLARFNADGTRDESFFAPPRGAWPASALAVGPGGELVVAGTAGPTTTRPTPDFFVARYDASGRADPGFGMNRTGLVVSDLGGTEQLGDIALLPDNSIVAAGTTRLAGADPRLAGDFAVARYTPAGVLDSAFGGGDGVVTVDVGSGGASADAVAVDAEGRIVAGGQAVELGRSTDFALARLEGDGPVGPNVAELSVGSAAFAAPFRAYLDASGVGGAGGFSVVNFVGNPTVFPGVLVTQAGVNQVTAQLRGPGAGELLGADDLRVRGVNVADYGVAGFAYDPASRLATWTLNRPVAIDRLAVEMNVDADADFELRWRVDVLAGDADGNGQINGLDLADVRRRLGKVATLPPVFSTSGYSYTADVTGDGRINALDLAGAKQRLGSRLPTAQPPASTAVDGAATAPLTATSSLLRQPSDLLLQSPVGG